MIDSMRKASLALLLAGGCVTHERVPDSTAPATPPPSAVPTAATPPPSAAPTAAPPEPPNPVPPPPAQSAGPPRAVEERQAVKTASDYARAKGLSVERYKANLDQYGNWRVDLRSDHGNDRAKVLVDGRTGRVLRAKLQPADDWGE
jgi:hypothetical protein